VARAALGTTRDAATPPELLMLAPRGFPGYAELTHIEPFGDRLYWISDAPSVGWVDADGESCSELLRLDDPFDDFLLSADHVYFTYESDVYRVPRE